MNIRQTALILILAFIGIAITGPSPAQGPTRLHVGNFSLTTPGGPLPDAWQPLTFEKTTRHTKYDIVKEDKLAVLRAISNDSASSLQRSLTIDAKAFPIVTWRWKTTNVLTKGDLSSKKGDDYAARLYINFAYDPAKADFITRAKYKAAKLIFGTYPPLYCINYIWANKAPVGTRVLSPYTDRALMIVLESGPDRLDRWVVERRNVFDDYRKAFGHDPPTISSVAIMSDTDNTHENVTTFYGDIWFEKPTAK